jgi:transposase
MSVESGIAPCWAVEGYAIVAAEVKEGKGYLDLQPQEQQLQCSVCGSRDLVRRGTVLRQLRTLPIGRQPVFLRVPVQRVYCRCCRHLRQVPLGCADPRRSYTRSFERLVLELCEVMCLQDVAAYLQIGWDLVKEIYARCLEQRRATLNLRGLRKLAIDELNVGKGRLLSLVLDLESGTVVHVGRGKSGQSLAPFFTALQGQWGADPGRSDGYERRV